ncbi:unnamed protein product, partial [Rotaria sordida]
MNTRSKISLTNISIKNLQLPHKQRQTTATKSSLLPNISSFLMSSKDNPNRDSSYIQTQITNEQIKNLFADNAILQKQLGSKTLLAVEERIEKDDSLHSNQQQNQQIHKNQQTSEFNEEQLPDLNDNHSNALDEKPPLLDFLRDHILPFSGNENAYQWFIQMDLTFSNLKLSFDDRLKILPYFFDGRSMIWYSLNKHKINCYTDFCQLFTLEYINTKQTPDSHTFSQSSNKYSLVNSQLINGKDSNNKSIDHLTNTTTPFISYHVPSTDLNNSTLSHSLSPTISKALIDKFIKDPIKFYGGKDSVINWLEEIEQQFHIMQLSEFDKFNLIQICLKGDAQQWYRQNKKYFVSWSQFVTEIKKSYHSNLQRDIAFKKLQQYHQTTHQSAFQYYNEMLKLIQQADPDMSESTKVHYLMNGLRSSLSVETRRNYPKTTQEFLTQVKIAEDLTALNTTFINQSMIHDDLPPSISSSYSKPINFTSTNEFNDYPTNSIVNNDYNNYYYYSDNNNQHHYLNRIFKSSSYNSHDRNQSSNSFNSSSNAKPSSNYS